MQVGQKFNKSLSSFYKVLPGGLFGLIAMGLGLSGILIPLMNYPGYNIYKDMVSHLGTPWQSTSYLYFDYFIIFSGILNIPFVFYVGKIFIQEIGMNKWIKVAITWNLISSICLTFVGLYLSLSVYVNDLPFILHGFSAIIMFSGVAIYCFIYGNFMRLNRDKFPLFLAITSYVVAGFQIAFLVSWHSYIEWYATISLMAWIVIMSLYTLYKRY